MYFILSEKESQKDIEKTGEKVITQDFTIITKHCMWKKSINYIVLAKLKRKPQEMRRDAIVRFKSEEESPTTTHHMNT